MDDRVARLEQEVEELHTQLARVRRELDRIVALVASQSNFSAVTNISVAGYRGGSSEAPPTPERVTAPSSPALAASASSDHSSRVPQSWSVRERICDEIALWIIRCLAGEHRGSSGRDRISLPSRVWVVVRDFEGTVFSPVRIYTQFASCKPLVKRGSDLGESIFVGLPSQREAFRVIAAAGLVRPSELLD